MKYQKKPVTVEAFQWDGEQELSKYPEWLSNKFKNGDIWITDGVLEELEPSLNINTLEGVMNAEVGDFIIQGVHGEVYSCKPDIFEETYMKVEGD